MSLDHELDKSPGDHHNEQSDASTPSHDPSDDAESVIQLLREELFKAQAIIKTVAEALHGENNSHTHKQLALDAAYDLIEAVALNMDDLDSDIQKMKQVAGITHA